jgi:hypothetical protein
VDRPDDPAGGGALELVVDQDSPRTEGSDIMNSEPVNPLKNAARWVKEGERPSTLDRILNRDKKESGQAEGGQGDEAEKDLEPAKRRSYCILRGRMEMLPTITFINQEGQERGFAWAHYAGVDRTEDGKVVLLFDGANGVTRITVSGSRLEEELLPGVKANRVESIEELDELTIAKVHKDDPAEPVVRRIAISGGGREWSRGGGGA